WLQRSIGLSAATATKLEATLLVLVALWLVQRITLAIVWRRTHDGRLRYRWQKATAYITTPIALLIVGRIWFAGFQSIATFLGLVSFESDWEKAKQLLLEIVRRDSEEIARAAEHSVRETTRKFMIFYTNLTPTVYTSGHDSGVLLTLRYLCEPRQRRVTEQEIWEDILREFAKHDDIDPAYLTRRGFNHVAEGKPGTRASELPGRID